VKMPMLQLCQVAQCGAIALEGSSCLGE
jgi:hypothetical protein